MSNLPITSRIKRSPLLQVEAAATSTTKGEDKKEIVNVTKKSSYDGKKMSDEEWNALTPEKRRELNAAVGANEKGEIITETKEEKIIPGEDKKVQTKLYEKQEQDVMQPWEIRQQSRATKKANRDVSVSQRKIDSINRRLANMKPEDKVAGNKKYDRLQRKLTENTNEMKDFKAGRDRVSESRASGRRAGTTIRRKEDRVKTRGDYGDAEQLQQASETYSPGSSSSQAEGAINVTTATGTTDSTTDPTATSTDVKFGEYKESGSAAQMKRSPYKMKAKSPAAKALQGNQNKLPQHLQDAIKAAPGKMKSGLKMKSGFKMKGYGKK